ncbi:MAG: efflux RND transporter periplasmic adaptor subunit [Verrucomicrobia bacterium]|nr:efflux RND transporter periplasmic adaptor subunit [Verrucomicrobiota bacterium]
MDIPRPELARRKRRRRLLVGIAALLGLALVTVLLSRLKPAAPLVENAYTDTVKRGEMLRQVRGNGTLIPEEIRWIPAQNPGRIERINVLPGAAVKADTIILELSNPELTQAAFDAEWQVKGAEAEQANLRVQLESQRLTEQAAATTAQSNYKQAQLDAQVNEELSRYGLIPAITLRQSETKAEELLKVNDVEQQRLKIMDDSIKAQLAVEAAKIEQLRAQYQLKREQVDSLKVRAGIDGVLQMLGDGTTPLRAGQQFGAGANLARVANPARLKAEVKIAETQAKDIQLGQKAEVDTRNGVIPGHVIRIDPSVVNGTVTVDVGLDGPLPKGARPDLTVDGTIELERLVNVLYVGRPVQGQAESKVSLFKVVDGGAGAVRVPVTLGRSSVSTIEIVNGLQVGDSVVLSDMSQWDAYDRVRLR